MVKLVSEDDLLNAVSAEEVKGSIWVHVLDDLFDNADLSRLDVKRKVNELKETHEKEKFGCVLHTDGQDIIDHSVHIVNRGVHDVSRVHILV